MDILIVGNHRRYELYAPDFVKSLPINIAYCDADTPVSSIVAANRNAEVMFASLMFPVSAELIGGLPRLKLIHAEGVGYEGIDLDAARERGIYVCNCSGCNAGSVAEITVMLMLMLARRAVPGYRAVVEGRQTEYRDEIMRSAVPDFADYSVGLVGLGAIGLATAKRLNSFGNRLYYYEPHRRSAETERELNLTYLPLDELAAACDILSLHCPVTPETQGMANAALLAKMKPGSYLVNTSRGQLIDNQAVREALISGHLAGAGFDTLYPEPTPADHPLVALPAEVRERVAYTPHLAGGTKSSFLRGYKCIWENARRIINGERPVNIVNGL